MRKLRNCILLVAAFAGFNAWAISAPSITSCTRASSTSVSLSWTSVSGAAYYVVRRSYSSSVGASSSIATPSGTSYTDSQAGVDTCYYWVEAWDNSGASARSGMATASSGSGGGGGGSGGSFSINASDGTSTEGVTITWSAQSGATGYRVVRGTSSNLDNANILVETVSGTSYTDKTAVAGKTYYYWIVAKKSSGYVTSSYNTGYKASSSSGGGDDDPDPGTGGGTTPSYDGNPYTVQFNANGGEGTMANESFVYGTAKALTISTFKRTGYIFIGWSTSSTATTPTYDDGQSVKNLTTTSGGTVKLYAVWQANAYTIKFNKNGGSGTMADLAMKYDTAKALTANAFQRPNYNFLGWATSSGATSATYTNKQSVKNLVSTPDGSITLYAVWQVVREVTALTARQRYPWNGLVDIDVTFRAAGLSTVSFEIKDTKGNTNLNARTFYLGNPEKKVTTLEVQPGTHRFVWDAAADLGSVTIPSFVVTAKVQEKFYNVNVTGGTGSGSFVQGKSATLTAADKTGYTFDSWSGSSADTGLLVSATSASTTLTIPSRDVAYEATYTPNTYTVKFNANGGSGTMAYESFTYDTAKALTANAFTRNGWTFKGWSESADVATAKYTDKQSVKNLATAGTKNLYAVWDPQSVQLWANGPYWSSYNVGANNSEEFGYYFSWGDTVGYTPSGGTWDSSSHSYQGVTWTPSSGENVDTPFAYKNCMTMDKDKTQLMSAGYVDSTGNLVASHDAATAHLGSPWRLPTDAEWTELIAKCTVKWTTRNNVYGCLVTGKGSYASKSIFLPAAGNSEPGSLHRPSNTSAVCDGEYWSSTPSNSSNYDNNYNCACVFTFGYYDQASSIGVKRRCNGCSVRPVRGSAQ